MKHIEIPEIDQEIVELIKNTEVNDIDEIIDQAIEMAVNIDKMPRDHEMVNEDLACLFLAWYVDNGDFCEALGTAGVDPTLIFELEFICCCILKAVDKS